MGGAVPNSPTKTITLAQAQQMGLLSPGKVRNIQLSPVKPSSSSTQEVKQIVIRSSGNANTPAQSQPQVIRIPASSLQPGTIQQLQMGNRVQYVRVIGQTQGNQVIKYMFNILCRRYPLQNCCHLPNIMTTLFVKHACFTSQ
jgi:hypothetical protein